MQFYTPLYCSLQLYFVWIEPQCNVKSLGIFQVERFSRMCFFLTMLAHWQANELTRLCKNAAEKEDQGSNQQGLVVL